MWLNILKGAGIVVGFLPKLKRAFGLLGIVNDVNEACMYLGNGVRKFKAFVRELSADLQVKARDVLSEFDQAFEKLADICGKLRLRNAETFLRDVIKDDGV